MFEKCLKINFKNGLVHQHLNSALTFVFEKCLQPKKPLYADNGDGCAAFKIKWLLFLLINYSFLCA